MLLEATKSVVICFVIAAIIHVDRRDVAFPKFIWSGNSFCLLSRVTNCPGLPGLRGFPYS